MLPDVVRQVLPETYSVALKLLDEFPDLRWVQTEDGNGSCDYRTKTFHAPAPLNAAGFAIFTHEVGHLTHSSEETAWKFTRAMIYRFQVPRQAQDQFLKDFSQRAPAINHIFKLA